MASAHLQAPAAYIVGFGKPPKANQFAPGVSGNPAGRPKGARSVASILQEIVRQSSP